MISPILEQEIREQLDQLAPEQQRQVLDFARELAATRIKGVAGHTLLRFAGTIDVEDLATIAQTIEEDCESVDRDEW